MSDACLNCDQPFMNSRQRYCDRYCRTNYHVSRGICINHPSQPIIPNRKHCSICRRLAHQKYIIKRDSNICLSCGKLRYSGSNQFCKPCHLGRLEYFKTRGKNLFDQGLCESCARNPRYNYNHCEPCRLKRYNQKLIKKNHPPLTQMPIHLRSQPF